MSKILLILCLLPVLVFSKETIPGASEDASAISESVALENASESAAEFYSESAEETSSAVESTPVAAPAPAEVSDAPQNVMYVQVTVPAEDNLSKSNSVEAMPGQQAQKKAGKKNSWSQVVTGFLVVGFAGLALYSNDKAREAVDEYSPGRDSYSYVKDNVEEYQKSRNAYAVLSAAFTALFALSLAF